MSFATDSASSDVSISSFSTLVRAGTIRDDNMIDTQSYRRQIAQSTVRNAFAFDLCESALSKSAT